MSGTAARVTASISFPGTLETANMTGADVRDPFWIARSFAASISSSYQSYRSAGTIASGTPGTFNFTNSSLYTPFVQAINWTKQYVLFVRHTGSSGQLRVQGSAGLDTPIIADTTLFPGGFVLRCGDINADHDAGSLYSSAGTITLTASGANVTYEMASFGNVSA
ncbi:MAG: hypothetical protein IT438_16475 [Phycisphaerales bacterium]|nr:hypothetical protein [Phycisphaerales bacterium]